MRRACGAGGPPQTQGRAVRALLWLDQVILGDLELLGRAGRVVRPLRVSVGGELCRSRVLPAWERQVCVRQPTGAAAEGGRSWGDTLSALRGDKSVRAGFRVKDPRSLMRTCQDFQLKKSWDTSLI